MILSKSFVEGSKAPAMEVHTQKVVELQELVNLASFDRNAIILGFLAVWAVSFLLSSQSPLYLLISWNSRKAGAEEKAIAKPTVVPGGLPFFGHALPFFWNRAKLAASVR